MIHGFYRFYVNHKTFSYFAVYDIKCTSKIFFGRIQHFRIVSSVMLAQSEEKWTAVTNDQSQKPARKIRSTKFTIRFAVITA